MSFANPDSVYSSWSFAYCSFNLKPLPQTERIDAWYIIVKASEEREGYEDMETARPERPDDYQPIAQFDRTYQTIIVRDGVGEHSTYAEVVSGSTSQPKNNVNTSSDAPPSYSAIAKGGISNY